MFIFCTNSCSVQTGEGTLLHRDTPDTLVGGDSNIFAFDLAIHYAWQWKKKTGELLAILHWFNLEEIYITFVHISQARNSPMALPNCKGLPSLVFC